MTFTAKQKLACAKRELGMRQRVYPGWVGKGRMSRDEAASEIALMEAIVLDYEYDVEMAERQMKLDV